MRIVIRRDAAFQAAGVEMATHVFYLVDVFAEEKYSGNQLAVVNCSSRLTSQQMQKIANEMHFSETSFITSNRKEMGGYNVRIFTPTAEVPFAGHPTLGTAFVIRRLLLRESADAVLLNLKIGQISVRFEKGVTGNEILWMKQQSPIFGKKFEVERFSEILGLSLSDFDVRYQIQMVSTGLPFIIVPLKNLEAVKKSRVNQNKQLEFAKEIAAGILVFSNDTYSEENDLNVRVFVDAFGIPEDPATGSGNGCLAAYLSRYKYFGSSNLCIKVEQGFELGRPSLLHLQAGISDEKINIQVGGRVFLVGHGELV
jgi:trans-2,3-dihydro-3-hydroxyanthranilate isomerase